MNRFPYGQIGEMMGVMDRRVSENAAARSHLMISTMGIPARQISVGQECPTYVHRARLNGRFGLNRQ